MRWTAVGWVAILAMTSIPLPAPSAEAAIPSAPWWTPSDVKVTAASQYEKAWNLRVPLQLGPLEQALPAQSPVQVHLDLGQEAVRAGWPQAAGKPKSFTLDPDSIAVIRYGTNWNSLPRENRDPVPSETHLNWLEPDQVAEYGKRQTSPFDAQRNPVVTVEWRLEKALPPLQVAYYQVYFNIEEHADKAPLAQPQHSGEALQSLYWTGAGTLLYGHHPGAPNLVPTLTVVGTQDDSRVTVSTYGNSPLPTKDDAGRAGNPTGANHPFRLDRGQVQTWTLGLSATNFQIESDKPVLGFTHAGDGSGDFVPSLASGPLGTEFLLPPRTGPVHLIAPALPGDGPNTRISIHAEGFLGDDSCSAGIWPAASPRFCILQPDPASDQAAEIRVEASDEAYPAGHPVLVQQAHPAGGAGTWAQAASAYGGPTGTTFLASTLPLASGGFSLWASVAAQAAISDATDAVPVVYADDVGITGGQATVVQGLGMAPIPGRAETPPLTIVSEVIPGADSPSPIRVLHGSRQGGPAQTTPFGGPNGRSFTLESPFVVQPFYDGTEVAVSLAEQSATRTLSQGEAYVVLQGGSGSLAADKPVSVFPLGNPQHYSRFLAARPAFAQPTIHEGEYRSYLVDIRGTGNQESSFFEALPGQTLRIPFIVQNLGRWDGQPLPDAIRLQSTTNPVQWPGAQAFSANRIALGTNVPTAAYLDVQIPADMPVDSQVTITVSGQSEGNGRMQAEFTAVIFTRQRYGVDLWFGDGQGGSTENSITAGFNPGQAKQLPITLQNLGTGPDSFVMDLVGTQGSWSARLLQDGKPAKVVGPLAAGSTAALTLEVQAPEAVTETDVFVTVAAASQTQATAVDRIRLRALLNLGQDVDMAFPEAIKEARPGETVDFVAAVRNTGKEGVSLLFELIGELGPAWSVQFTGLGDPEQGPVSLAPGAAIEVPLQVTVPPDAGAGDLGTALLRAAGASDRDRDLIVSRAFATEVVAVRAVELLAPDSLLLEPGQNLTVELTLVNNGNLDERFLLAGILPPGWSIQLPGETIVAGFGQQKAVLADIRVPSSALAGPIDAQLVATTLGTSAVDNITLVVAKVESATFDVPAPRIVRPGETGTMQLVLRNRGNVPASLRMTVESPGGWEAHVSPPNLDVAPGTYGSVTLNWSAPQNPGEALLTVRADAEGFAAVTEVPMVVRTSTMVLDRLVVPAPELRPGEVGYVTAVMRNAGDTTLKDFDILLRRQGAVLDRAHFDSIGPNATVVAALRWIADHQGAPVLSWGQLAAGPEGLEEEPLPVVVGEPPVTKSTPWPAPGALFLALLLSLWRRKSHDLGGA